MSEQVMIEMLRREFSEVYHERSTTDEAIARITAALGPSQSVSAQPAGEVPVVIELADSRVRRIYLAGPMTGYADYNFPAFNAEATRLRAEGLHVENPAEHGLVEGATWEDYMRYDLGRIATCASIHLLPGWSKSNGARIEVGLAQALGMPIGYADGAEGVAALQARAVVMPERMKTEPFTTIDRGSKNYKAGWNGCLNEVARLNGKGGV